MPCASLKNMLPRLSAASESLTHAQAVGEILSGLGGHPILDMSFVKETRQHEVIELLKKSLAH